MPIVLLGPPVAWLLALGLSYIGQDFACSAARSAGRASPGTGLTATVILIDIVLLLVTMAAGVLAARLYADRDHRRAGHTAAFVGLTGVALAVLFSFGIVLIAVNPTVLGAC